jgi:hypothetical protein
VSKKGTKKKFPLKLSSKPFRIRDAKSEPEK